MSNWLIDLATEFLVLVTVFFFSSQISIFLLFLLFPIIIFCFLDHRNYGYLKNLYSVTLISEVSVKLCLFSFVSVGINSYYKLFVLVFMLSHNFACLFLKMYTKHLNKCRNSVKSWIMLFFLLIKNTICFNKTPRSTINL